MTLMRVMNKWGGHNEQFVLKRIRIWGPWWHNPQPNSIKVPPKGVLTMFAKVGTVNPLLRPPFQGKQVNKPPSPPLSIPH